MYIAWTCFRNVFGSYFAISEAGGIVVSEGIRVGIKLSLVMGCVLEQDT